MAWIQCSSQFKIMVGLLALGLSLNVSEQAKAQQPLSSLSNKIPKEWDATFKPPSGRGNPSGREGGATRGDQCTAREQNLTPLVPPSGFGSTIAKYPTFFWYMPQTEARAMRFTLLNKEQQEVYSTTFAIAGTPGIKSLQLPSFASLTPLPVDQEYHWQLVLIVNPLDSNENICVEGSIQRLNQGAITSRINQSSPQNKVAMYAEAGLWYDTVTSLVELRRSSPNDSTINNVWLKLLKSVGLEEIAQQPVVEGFSVQSASNN